MYAFEGSKRHETKLINLSGHDAGSLQVHLDEHTLDRWEQVCEIKLADGNHLLLKRVCNSFS